MIQIDEKDVDFALKCFEATHALTTQITTSCIDSLQKEVEMLSDKNNSLLGELYIYKRFSSYVKYCVTNSLLPYSFDDWYDFIFDD